MFLLWFSTRSIVDAILDAVIESPHESEVIEFKDRKNLNKDEMSEYFSAFSNEASSKVSNTPG